MISLLAALLVVALAHLFLNHSLFYPTTTLALLFYCSSSSWSWSSIDLRRGGYGF